jgi:hypothetical protein
VVRQVRVLRYGRPRSALLIAIATVFVVGTAALAASSPSPFSPSSSPSSHATGLHSPKANESPEASESPEPSESAKASPGAGSQDSHGDCVSAAAHSKTAGPNETGETDKGKANHGDEVSEAAHACPKGNDQEGPDNASPEPSDTPESPEPSETPGD